jgi:hypothetical protein
VVVQVRDAGLDVKKVQAIELASRVADLHALPLEHQLALDLLECRPQAGPARHVRHVRQQQVLHLDLDQELAGARLGEGEIPEVALELELQVLALAALDGQPDVVPGFCRDTERQVAPDLTCLDAAELSAKVDEPGEAHAGAHALACSRAPAALDVPGDIGIADLERLQLDLDVWWHAASARLDVPLQPGLQLVHGDERHLEDAGKVEVAILDGKAGAAAPLGRIQGGAGVTDAWPARDGVTRILVGGFGVDAEVVDGRVQLIPAGGVRRSGPLAMKPADHALGLEVLQQGAHRPRQRHPLTKLGQQCQVQGVSLELPVPDAVPRQACDRCGLAG